MCLKLNTIEGEKINRPTTYQLVAKINHDQHHKPIEIITKINPQPKQLKIDDRQDIKKAKATRWCEEVRWARWRWAVAVRC